MNTRAEMFKVGEEPAPLRSPQGRTHPAEQRATSKTNKTAGRFQTINTFADFSIADLSRAEIAVWILLWRDTKSNGVARTSQADLARRAGVNVRTVGRAVKNLCQKGHLKIVHRGGFGRGTSAYRVRPLARE